MLSTISIVFGTHFLGALTGFGCTILAMPFLIPILGLEAAKPLLLIMGTTQPLFTALQSRKHIRWDILWTILLWVLLGIPLGFYLYDYLPQAILLIILGCVMLFAGGSGIARTAGRPLTDLPKIVLITLLVIGGILQGAFVTGGPLIVIYASLVLHDKHEFRGTLSVLWVLVNTIVIIQSYLTGQFVPEVNKLILWNLPFLLIAVWVGNSLANKVSKTLFDYILNIVLIVAGLITIFNQVRLLINFG